MFGIIYETRNRVNGMLYRGQHHCTAMGCRKRRDRFVDCHYLGSGKAMRRAIRKYGRENFERRTLAWCKDQDILNEYEAAFVDEAWVARPDTYNIMVGGGAYIHPEQTESSNAKRSAALKGRQTTVMTEEIKEKIRATLTGRKITPEQHARLLNWRKEYGAWNKGLPMTGEHSKNLTAAQHRRYARPEEREAARQRSLRYYEKRRDKMAMEATQWLL